MAENKETYRKLLRERFEKLTDTPIPTGFGKACDNLVISLNEYNGYIAGLVLSFLKDFDTGIDEISKGRDIEEQIQRCRNTLDEIASHKKLLDEIVDKLESTRHAIL